MRGRIAWLLVLSGLGTLGLLLLATCLMVFDDEGYVLWSVHQFCQNHALKQAKVWVAWVFIWQTLHAYPVAGTQLVWGTFLFIPVVVIGWFGAIERLRLRFPKIKLVAVAVPLLAASLATAQLIEYGRIWWRFSIPLGLPDAR